MNRKPYYSKRDDGMHTFHCPHEPEREVFVIPFKWGEMAICNLCMSKIVKEVALDLHSQYKQEGKQTNARFSTEKSLQEGESILRGGS